MGNWGIDESFGDSCLRRRAVRDMLRFIASRHRQGKTVLVRDLVSELKRGTSSVHYQLESLADEGFIHLDGAKDKIKVVVLTDKGAQMAVRCGAPVLGHVPAGLLRAVPETDGRDCEGCQQYLETWDDTLPPSEDYGVLFVKGDSMIEECIRPGDQVQLKLGVSLHELEEGEIAAVMVGDDYEATLKYVYFSPLYGMVTLKAANPQYSDIHVKAADVRVVGSLFGLVRTFGKGRK